MPIRRKRCPQRSIASPPKNDAKHMKCASLIVRGSTDKEICLHDCRCHSPIWIDTLPDEFDRNEIVDWNLHYYLTFFELSQDCSRYRAYTELSSYGSELNKRGRKIAANIKTVSDRPTYYCLIDRFTLSVDPSDDKCPSCGSSWYRPPKKDAKGLDKYEFCCHDCLLLKERALKDPDDDARLGNPLEQSHRGH